MNQLFSFILGALMAFYPGISLGLYSLFHFSFKKIDMYTYLSFLGLFLWLIPIITQRRASFIADVLQILLYIMILVATKSFNRQTVLSMLPGLSIGIIGMALISLIQYLQTFQRIDGLQNHPNIWAMQAVGVSLLILSLNPKPIWLLLSTISCLIVISLSGSRTSLICFSVGLLLLLAQKSTNRYKLRPVILLSLALFLVLSLIVPSWRQRLSESLGIFQPTVSSHNLFTSSQNLLNGLWQPQRVSVRIIANSNAWAIQKTGEENWARLQQQVILLPNTTYTLSGEFKALGSEIIFGFLGSGKMNGKPTELRFFLLQTTPQVRYQGDLSIFGIKAESLSENWWRLEISFTYNGEKPLRWWLGPTPDQKLSTNTSIEVRALQLEIGNQATTYEATYVPELAVSNFQSRWPAFQVAWKAFLEKPLLGHSQTFYDYYLQNPLSTHPFISNHAHNLVLQTLFERGLVGMLGYSIVFIVLICRTKSYTFIVLCLCILLGNTLDYTLWSASSLYILAAASGWLAHDFPEL